MFLDMLYYKRYNNLFPKINGKIPNIRRMVFKNNDCYYLSTNSKILIIARDLNEFNKFIQFRMKRSIY